VEYLAGLPGKVLGRLTVVRADELHEMCHIVQRSPRPKPWYLRQRLSTHRTCALQVALLGVGAGKERVALDASPQVGRAAELDRLGRELFSLVGLVEVTEAARQVPGQPSLIEIDPWRVLGRR
jgi:hypothetical protein